MEPPSSSPTKYIFVTGGVVSALGKGIACASIGRLLKERDLQVTIQKFDPYINVDPGTMSPFQHGEVFVTEDGAETDMDLGHYERFLDEALTAAHNCTSGEVYQDIITRERRGDFLGSTVQVIPHVTDELKAHIRRLAPNQDVVITEIGGTVGDIESLPFFEASRQFRQDVGRENTLFLHLTLVPYLEAAGELKTKPTQHSVRALMETGIQPDIIITRCERSLTDKVVGKIARFCNVAPKHVIEAQDLETIYEVPLQYHRQQLDDHILEFFDLLASPTKLSSWKTLVQRIKRPDRGKVRIGVVGKYTRLTDAYISIQQALIHAGAKHNLGVAIDWVSSERLASDSPQQLANYDGVLIPGGFGTRGVAGMLEAVRYVRKHDIPYPGICLGLQCSIIEFARNVCGLENPHSAEFAPESDTPVISLLDEQRQVVQKGGTMRLGAHPCRLQVGSAAARLYGTREVSERHRHRYEVNNRYREQLTEQGMLFSGLSPDNQLVEIIELPDHPFFVATQFHPEFRSRPTRPHPLFSGFIAAAQNRAASR